MQRMSQSPTDPAFVQDPYPFYDRLRAAGPLVWWDDYAMPVAASHAVVSALLRDKRFGREDPAPPSRPAHQAAFWAIEDHSMLEAEPPRHTRLRAQVLRAFTSRRVGALIPEIEALAAELANALPREGPFDLLDAYARPLPVRVIARLLGVPEEDAPQLLAWSNAMVGMYQARRTRAHENAAAKAAAEFADYLHEIFRTKRMRGADDLISHLLAVSEDGRLSPEEVTATCILLLNAGHEATVHTLGNAVAGLIEADLWGAPVNDALVEEVLRHNPPLHMFTRFATQDIEVFDHRFARGDQVGLLLAAANRDPAVHPNPARLKPTRYPDAAAPLSFGAGIHFCLGAPLARLELRIGLSALAQTHPALRVTETTSYANIYHFRGFSRLEVDSLP